MTDRPRGGRRPEDFPDVRARDDRIMRYLTTLADAMSEAEVWDPPGMSRNELVAIMGAEPRKVSYALERLRTRGLVEHVPHGNEGHGYWKITEQGDDDDQV